MSGRSVASEMSQQPERAGNEMSTGETPRRPATAPPRRQPRYTHASGERPLDGYTIKRGIGVGGFGEVYFAISDAGKEVALKRIQRNLDIELRGVRQCLNLKHVNLIALWDIRTGEQGESWVVMEYVPGHSLRDQLQQFPRGMLEADVRHWFLPICAGVAYLHDRGIVHRDLKPGNIFYDTDAQLVKIGDYGLSKFISCSRGSGHTESVGTFHYMAPEIGRGVYGKGIDIYALGVILFEMLTGELPFDGESTQEIIMKHLTASPDLRRVPGPLREVVEVALAKDPAERYGNVRELLSALPWDEARLATGPAGMAAPAPLSTAPAGREAPTGLRVGAVDSGADGGILYIGDEGVEELPAGVSLGPLTHRNSGGFDLRSAAPLVGGSAAPGLTTLPEASVRAVGQPVRGAGGEPVARAVRDGISSSVQWFQEAPLATPIKILIAAGAIFVLAINSAWLLPTAIVLGLCYLIYFAIRSWAVRADHEVTPAEKRQVAGEIRAEAMLRGTLGSAPFADRLADLLGSLLMAALFCAVAGLGCLAAGGGLFSAGLDAWARLAWLVGICMGASWAVLVAGKFWEQQTGNPWQRRIVMAGVGMGVGLAAFLLGEFLMLGPATGLRVDDETGAAMLQRGLPRLAASLTLFTALFGLLRWWRMADPVRKTRVSLWSSGLCAVVAVGLASVAEVNPFWPGMVALITSVAIQAAAPWVDRDRRGRAAAVSWAPPRA